MLTNLQKKEDGTYVLSSGLGLGEDGDEDELDLQVEASMTPCGVAAAREAHKA